MSTAVKYFTFAAPQNNRNIHGQLPLDQQNLIFNFPQSFFNDLQSITSEELAQSVPYISLHVVDSSGEIISDLNVGYFFKGAEIDSMGQSREQGDRPILSLKNLTIATKQESGYIYFDNVDLTLKVHTPRFLQNSIIISLLFEGQPHLLEFGWNSPNPKLNFKKTSWFSVVTYDLSFSEDGQMELKIKGQAFNNSFENVFVGDDGSLTQSKIISNLESQSLYSKKTKLDLYEKYLKELKHTGNTNLQSDIVKVSADDTRDLESRARDTIDIKFNNGMEQLGKIAGENFNSSKEKHKKRFVTLHDIIYNLCDGTLKALTDTMPSADSFKVIYGNVNNTLKSSSIQSLADFPIDFDDFTKKIKNIVKQGQFLVTLQRFLNLLISEYMMNSTFWRESLPDDSPEDLSFNEPLIISRFFNIGGEIKLYILDVREGVPPTLTTWPKPGEQYSEDDLIQRAINSAEIPNPPLGVIKLGHANAFVKQANLSQISDPYMKANLINRMNEIRTNISERDSQSTGKTNAAKASHPIHLPVQGVITVLGHVEWTPFRSFYLDAGIFLVSGIYKIMDVTHVIDASGFKTELRIMYN